MPRESNSSFFAVSGLVPAQCSWKIHPAMFDAENFEPVVRKTIKIKMVLEIIHAQRLADDFVWRHVPATPHLPADEPFLMWREQNIHG
jgi:hypothetical protein